MTGATRRLTVYSRSYCHLCDDMIVQLRPFEAQHGVIVDIVDVENDPALEQKYGERVPVLVAGDEEVCHYHLDPDKLRAYLTEKR